MKLIKISPKFQITIPSSYRNLCCSGWFAFTVEDKVITLRPVEIKEVQTDKEVLDGILNEFGVDGFI